MSNLDQTGEVTTHAIRYIPNSADLDTKSKPVLDDMVQYLKSHPTANLEILDAVGDGGFSLSQHRADMVKAYFVAAGIDGNRLVAHVSVG